MKPLLLFAALFIIGSTFGQDVIKYRTTGVCFKFEDDAEYSEWEDANVLITVDLDVSKRIKVYSDEKQVLDVIEILPSGENVVKLSCVDALGQECRVRIVLRDSKQLQLYLDYDFFSVAYNIYPLD